MSNPRLGWVSLPRLVCSAPEQRLVATDSRQREVREAPAGPGVRRACCGDERGVGESLDSRTTVPKGRAERGRGGPARGKKQEATSAKDIVRATSTLKLQVCKNVAHRKRVDGFAEAAQIQFIHQPWKDGGLQVVKAGRQAPGQQRNALAHRCPAQPWSRTCGSESMRGLSQVLAHTASHPAQTQGSMDTPSLSQAKTHRS